METRLPVFAVDLALPPPPALTTLFDATVEDVRLEIGFGGGENLISECIRYPRTGFIGVEPFVGGMAKFVAAAGEAGLKNVRLHDDDATQLLDWLPEASISGIDLFYPDPWPKRRHWKRRFVNRINLDRMARVLVSGGNFRFASDIDHYVDWTLLHCRSHASFEWQAHSAEDWRIPYAGWSGTRYEAKAMREGRTPAYLTFTRR